MLQRATAGQPRSFFMPGTDSSEEKEREYARLRAAAERDAGCAPQPRRIFSIGCRVAGHDCEVAVGEPNPVDGETVLAIFDVGGTDRYSVFTAADGDAPAMRIGRRVYQVTEFA